MIIREIRNQFLENLPKKTATQNFVSISRIFKLSENLFSFN
jgi:hypothetical protein